MARAQPNKQPTTPESGREPPYRLLTEALPAITYIVDLLPTPHTTYISPQVESILGFTPAEWLADPDFWTRQLHPDDRERILKAIRRHNKTGDSFFLEYRCLTQSGDPVWLRSSATYQRDEAGRLTAVHGVMLDITERVNSEQALRESEQRFKQLTGLFRNMADVMPDMVWAKDMDRRFIFVNRALCDNLLIARNLEEPIGKTDLFFSRREQESHPDDPDWHTLGQICQNSDAVVMESRETRRFEEFGNVQGRYLHLDVIKTPLWNEQGEMIGTVGTGRDITDRIRNEKALRESEARNRAFINAIPDIIFINRRDGAYLDFHAPDPDLLAAPPEEILKRSICDLLPADLADRCLQGIERALDSGDLQEFKYSLSIDGQPRHFEARITPCTEDTTLTTVRDITDRIRNERLLEDTKQTYFDILNSLTESIYVQDENGAFIDVNRGAEIMYRCTREELIGKTPAVVAAPGKNDLEEVKRLSREVFRTGQPARFNFWAVRKDGDVFPKEIVVNKGRYFGKDVLIAVARDISDKVRADTERDKLRSQLEQARRLESVGRLAGGVAHDFNNMLQTIIGNAELALEDLDRDHPLHRTVDEIHQAAQRSANLTRQLLAFARKQPIAPRLLDLNTAVADTLNMLQRLIGDGIQMAWHPASHACRVVIDPSQIDQLLVNLCVNARDAMSGQGVLAIETGVTTLRPEEAARHAGVEPGSFAVLAVRDTGAGMDTETLAHIFEPFFTTKEPGKGTGLGLATVYGIVRQNGGFITVDSAPGQGTTFEVHLPRHTAETSAAAPPPVPPPPAPGTETILFVEDDPSILDLATRRLSRLGYALITAGSPEEALSLAGGTPAPIHMLVTDIVMPGMNGRELAKQIQDIHPDIRSLFISGYSTEVFAPGGMIEPGIQFLPKPFSMSTLAVRIRAILDAPDPPPPA